MQTYLVQLRGEDEDDGDDRLALAGRHYFLSSVPSSTFIFFCFLSVLDPSALSLLRVFSLLVRALCFSLYSSVRRGRGVAQPETRLALLRWLANAPHCFCLSSLLSLGSPGSFFFVSPPPCFLLPAVFALLVPLQFSSPFFCGLLWLL